MENIIAISQTVSAVIVIVGTISGIITFTTKKGCAWIEKHIFVPIQKPLDEKIENLNISLKDLDMNRCKDYLTDFINDVENDVLKSDVQIQRAYEVYDKYLSLGGNSYIHSGFERLKEKGMI